MSPWEVLGTAAGWISLVFAALVVLALVPGILIGVWRGILKSIKTSRLKSKISLEAYLTEATAIALRLYKDEVFKDDLANAYRSGARWGWGFFHRK